MVPHLESDDDDAAVVDGQDARRHRGARSQVVERLQNKARSLMEFVIPPTKCGPWSQSMYFSFNLVSNQIGCTAGLVK